MSHSSQLPILFEDNHLLVVDKPAGIATMGALPGESTVVLQAAAYLKKKYNKPGNVFVGVVSRLDSRVSGVLVLARTSKAAGRLSDQIRRRSTQKRYLAWVELPTANASKSHEVTTSDWIPLRDHLMKNEREQRMQIVAAPNPQSQQAELQYRFLANDDKNALLEVDLITGRKHQIRAQLSAAGMPIVGDSKYGSSRKYPGGIALHCHRLTIMHPTLRKEMSFASSPLGHWQNPPRSFLAALRQLEE